MPRPLLLQLIILCAIIYLINKHSLHRRGGLRRLWYTNRLLVIAAGWIILWVVTPQLATALLLPLILIIGASYFVRTRR